MFAPQKKPKQLLRKEIIAFLDRTCGQADPKPGRHSCGMRHRNCLVLATSHKDAPRATPLEFFHEGLTLYIFGEPGGKIANIKRNRRVSAAVFEQPLDHAKVQTSLQIFGTAEMITLRSNPRLLRAKARKWNLYPVLNTFILAATKGQRLPEPTRKVMAEKLLKAITMLKITPNHIILREYRTDFTMPKYEWKK
ncbi:pyridoxamine 5'-phosphate oxidase family protein [Thermodesulfobacteriota bacterium]